MEMTGFRRIIIDQHRFIDRLEANRSLTSMTLSNRPMRMFTLLRTMMASNDHNVLYQVISVSRYNGILGSEQDQLCIYLFPPS